MVLKLKNVGLIESASIELNGITVIAGNNNSGKSTVSKALYCIGSSYSDTANQLLLYRMEAIARRTSFEFAKLLFDDKEKYVNDVALISELLATHHELKNIGLPFMDRDDGENENPNAQVDKLSRYLSGILSMPDLELMTGILTRKLDNEFDSQVHNVHAMDYFSRISLGFEQNEVSVEINENSISKVSDIIDVNNGVVYIDDINVIDISIRFHWRTRGFMPHGSHKQHLMNLLDEGSSDEALIDEIIASKKLSKVFELIKKVCPGKIISRGRSRKYSEGKHDEEISLVNVSMGIKAFAIIKTLLQKNWLKEGAIVILDEPEIHLHPEWQLVYAQMIVLLHKEFNISMLINSHSPYFVMAIEDYSETHGVLDKCKFYLAESTKKSASFKDVTGSTKEVYSKFLAPMQELENVRYS